MTDQPDGHPPIATRSAWLDARRRLLAEEKALTRAHDRLSAARRRLPMVRVDADYRFTSASGEIDLAGLFNGARQLIVGHFMFAPEWSRGCPNCSHLADEISPGHIAHLRERDTEFAYVSRAPIAAIERYKTERGWTFPWYSSHGSRFNYDFHVTLDPAVAPPEYNYLDAEALRAEGVDPAPGEPVELPGFSVFLRIDGEVFHTYSTYARGGESFGGAHYLLDMTPFGRQELFEDSPPGWPKRAS